MRAKTARLSRLASAVLVGAAYAVGFFIVVEGFVGAAEKDNRAAVLLPILVGALLELVLAIGVRKLVGAGRLLGSDRWVLSLSTVLLVAAYYGDVVVRYPGRLADVVIVVLGSGIFSLPAYLVLRRTAASTNQQCGSNP